MHNKYRNWIAAYVSALLCCLPQYAYALEVGNAVPSITLAAPGGTIELAKLKGKVVYVDFWASWCGPCKQSFPWMNDMQAKYAARGLEIVAINVDAKAPDAERFLVANTAKFKVAFDHKGESPKLFGVKNMPTSFVVDGDGKITFVHAGFRDADRASLETAIASALNQTNGKK